jgi:hypothetical protein
VSRNNRRFARAPRKFTRAVAVALVAGFLLPAIADAACPLPAPRPGAQAVNPFVTPFVYSANNSTFEAYRGFGPQFPQNDSSGALGTLAAPFDYQALALPDEVRWGTDENINESDVGLEWQAFVFYVSPALANASSILFTWKGYGAFRSRGAEATYLAGFDFVQGKWMLLAETGFSLSLDKTVIGEVSKNVSSFLSGNRIAFLVASEQGAPPDLGNVGRPGGRPVLTTYIETDYVEVSAYLPTLLPALDIPLDYLGTTYGRVAFRGPTLVEDGSITIAAGGTLELDHARLIMNGTDTFIRVLEGGSLRLLNGSVITDAPLDTDDGGPLDRHYSIEVLSGGEIFAQNATIENAGKAAGPTTSAGLYLQNATGTLCDLSVVGRDTAVVGDALHNVTVQSLRVNNTAGAGADLQLTNESSADALGLDFTRLAVSPDSSLTVRTAIRVAVVDTSGKPIRGADLKVTDDNVTVYASAGYGGSDPQTGRVTGFDDEPVDNLVGAVDRVYLGSTTPTFHATTIAAKYFEWNEARPVLAASPHTETFVMALSATQFLDAAAAWGYDQAPRNYSTMDSFGPGVSIVDYNGDGLLDVFVAGGATRGEAETASASANKLYRQNAGGGFTDVTDAVGLTSKGATAAAWGDFDNNGYPDLYLVYQGYGTDHSLLWPGQANTLYKNNGDGTFTNVTVAAGVGDRGHGSTAAWGDYDGDGFLDLYVGNVGWVLAWLVRNETGTLYHNNRDGTFTDVTQAMGVTSGVPGPSGVKQTLVFLGGDNATERALDSPAGSGFVQAAAWVDYDRDGRLDLYLAEDFGASVLYRNDGATFTLVTAQAGLQRVGSARGVQVADIDGDGWPDIIQANRWVDFAWRNNHDGTFTDVAAQYGLDEELPGTTPVPIDINLDGKVDLFVAGGRTSTFHAYAPSYLWQNRAPGRFADITASAGVATGNSRTMGAASGDINGDGNPDLVTANADGPSSLFLNQGPARPWMKVHLVGTVSPRDGQGAQVRLIPAGAASGPVQQVGAVGARGSQQPDELLFALNGPSPSDASPWSLEVLWTSGILQRVKVSAPYQVVTITEQSNTTVAPFAPLVVPEDAPLTLHADLLSSDPKANATAAVNWSLPAPDGAVTLTGQTAVHTFATPGHFVGSVTVVDRTGQVATAPVDITVLDRTTPAVGALPPVAATAGVPVELSATNATDNDPTFNTTGNFTWTFVENGEPVVLYGRSASHAFGDPGDYTVTLTVRDGANLASTGTFTVSVSAPSSFGVREVAVLLLVLVAAAVAANAIFKTRLRRRYEQEERKKVEAQKQAKAKAQRASSSKPGERKRLK